MGSVYRMVAESCMVIALVSSVSDCGARGNRGLERVLARCYLYAIHYML